MCNYAIWIVDFDSVRAVCLILILSEWVSVTGYCFSYLLEGCKDVVDFYVCTKKAWLMHVSPFYAGFEGQSNIPRKNQKYVLPIFQEFLLWNWSFSFRNSISERGNLWNQPSTPHSLNCEVKTADFTKKIARNFDLLLNRVKNICSQFRIHKRAINSIQFP